MKKHIIILSITISILVLEIIGLILIFTLDLLSEDKDLIWAIIIVMILLLFYPTAFFTYYYHIGKCDKKGNIFGLILFTLADTIVAIILIPLLVSPLFLMDYISIFKEDYRRYKWNRDKY